MPLCHDGNALGMRAPVPRSAGSRRERPRTLCRQRSPEAIGLWCVAQACFFLPRPFLHARPRRQRKGPPPTTTEDMCDLCYLWRRLLLGHADLPSQSETVLLSHAMCGCLNIGISGSARARPPRHHGGYVLSVAAAFALTRTSAEPEPDSPPLARHVWV